jgi:hypothetical protein
MITGTPLASAQTTVSTSFGSAANRTRDRHALLLAAGEMIG